MTATIHQMGVSLRNYCLGHPHSDSWFLRDLTVDIAPGEALLVTGPSGSGKSTLALALAGLISEPDDGVSSGELLVGGNRPDRSVSPIGLVLQQPEDQTILHTLRDDLSFGMEQTGVAPEEMSGRRRKALRQVGLDLPEDTSTQQLSGGQRQRLALAGALVMNPGLMVLDEPLQALDAEGVERVLGALDEARADRPLTLVVIDHDPRPWLSRVDRVIRLDGGRLTGSWAARDYSFESPRATLESFDPSPQRTSRSGAVVCEVRALRVGRGNRALPGEHSFRVRSGEILALTGPNGAGKTTLALTLAGLLPPRSGDVIVPRALGQARSVDVARSVAWVPQNPDHHHVATRVAEDLALTPRALSFPEAQRESLVEDSLRSFGLEALRERHPAQVSGGESRRVAVAAALIHRPPLVILDEPSQSLDDRAWVELVHTLRRFQEYGHAIVMVTHDRDLIRVLGAREYALPVTSPAPPPDPPLARAGWMRKANPLALLAAPLLVAVALVITLDLASAGVVLCASAVAAWASHIRASVLLTRLIPVALAALFAGVTIALYGETSGEVFGSWGIIVVSEGSLELAAVSVARILALASPAVILSAGMDPTRLADALSQLLRLPDRFVTGALAALRMVHVVGVDYQVLKSVRRVRGIGDRGRMRRVTVDVMWILIIALRRATTLAIAMESRGFGRTSSPTASRDSVWRVSDTLLVIAGAIVAVVAVSAAIVSGEFRGVFS